MNLQVIKKAGHKENFNPDKISRVTLAAGLSPDQSTCVTQRIRQWFQNQGKTEITTLEIRNKVIEELFKINKFAADAYTWYEKTKDGNLDSTNSAKQI